MQWCAICIVSNSRGMEKCVQTIQIETFEIRSYLIEEFSGFKFIQSRLTLLFDFSVCFKLTDLRWSEIDWYHLIGQPKIGRFERAAIRCAHGIHIWTRRSCMDHTGVKKNGKAEFRVRIREIERLPKLPKLPKYSNAFRRVTWTTCSTNKIPSLSEENL